MKTSDKLLLGMLVFILFLLTTGFAGYKYRGNINNNETLERKIIINDYDSLLVGKTLVLTIHANRDTGAVYLNYADFKIEGNTLSISGGKNVIVDLDHTIKYLKLDKVNHTHIRNIEADTLTLVAKEGMQINIVDAKIKKLNLVLNKGLVTLEKCRIQTVELDGKNRAAFFAAEGCLIDTLKGMVDKSTEVSFRGIKEVEVHLSGDGDRDF